MVDGIFFKVNILECIYNIVYESYQIPILPKILNKPNLANLLI